MDDAAKYILKRLCEAAIKQGSTFIALESVLVDARSVDIGDDEFKESIDILNRQGFLEDLRIPLGAKLPPNVTISYKGIDDYVSSYVADYDKTIESVKYNIAVNGIIDNFSLANATGKPLLIIDHILFYLQRKGLLCVPNYDRGILGAGAIQLHIDNLSPELKREIIHR